ncbi:MAG: hypothetical protein ACYCTL_05205 [Acidimicrobiales bacterium]
MDIEEFYEADERRRRSEEIELGQDWRDTHGARYELSWVVDTGELYVMREPTVPMTEDPFGDVFNTSFPVNELAVAVIGWIATQQELDALLDGWQQAMASPDGVGWLAERLRSRGVPREAPVRP